MWCLSCQAGKPLWSHPWCHSDHLKSTRPRDCSRRAVFHASGDVFLDWSHSCRSSWKRAEDSLHKLRPMLEITRFKLSINLRLEHVTEGTSAELCQRGHIKHGYHLDKCSREFSMHHIQTSLNAISVCLWVIVLKADGSAEADLAVVGNILASISEYEHCSCKRHTSHSLQQTGWSLSSRFQSHNGCQCGFSQWGSRLGPAYSYRQIYIGQIKAFQHWISFTAVLLQAMNF